MLEAWQTNWAHVHESCFHKLNCKRNLKLKLQFLVTWQISQSPGLANQIIKATRIITWHLQNVHFIIIIIIIIKPLVKFMKVIQIWSWFLQFDLHVSKSNNTTYHQRASHFELKLSIRHTHTHMYIYIYILSRSDP